MVSATTGPSDWDLSRPRSPHAFNRPVIGRAPSLARSFSIRGSASIVASMSTTIGTTRQPAPGVFHFTERSADRVLRAATAWITKPPSGDVRPWFAWVHLFDPHAPYRAPAAYARRPDAVRCRGRVDRCGAWIRARRASPRWSDGTYACRCDCRSRRVARRPRRNHARIVRLRCDAQSPVDRCRTGSRVHESSQRPRSTRISCPRFSICSASRHRPTSTDASLRPEILANAADGRPRRSTSRLSMRT